MGRVFFPLDEELALPPGNLAPQQQEHLVHLACWMPFAQVGTMLAQLLGVQVSEETVRRLTEQAGREMEAAQTVAAHQPWQQDHPRKKLPARLVISADGAYVPLIKGEWAEVRTMAIGEVQEKQTSDGKQEVHVGHLSYFSRMTDAETFTELAEVQTRRRKLIEAEQVGAVTDGADWLQHFLDVHRPDAQRILDFPHAAEHLGKLLEALEKAGQQLPARMLERCLHVLKHRGPRPLLAMTIRLSASQASPQEVREHLNYLRKREHLMQYPLFQQQGWPIGSGMVESANKLVVEARLKGAGMHWERTHVNPMLALRNGVCNECWHETWQTVGSQFRKQQALRRTRRAELRLEAGLVLCNPALLTSPALPPQPRVLPPSPSTILSASAPAATVPGSSRPSASHPWKRGPACAPKRFAKM